MLSLMLLTIIGCGEKEDDTAEAVVENAIAAADKVNKFIASLVQIKHKHY